MKSNYIRGVILTLTMVMLTGCSKITNMFSSTGSICDQIYAQNFQGSINTVEEGKTDAENTCKALITVDDGGLKAAQHQVMYTYETFGNDGKFTFAPVENQIVGWEDRAAPTDVDGINDLAEKWLDAKLVDQSCIKFWKTITDGKVSYQSSKAGIESCHTPRRMIEGWAKLDNDMVVTPAMYGNPDQVCAQFYDITNKNYHYIRVKSNELGFCRYVYLSIEGRGSDVSFSYGPTRGGGFAKITDSDNYSQIVAYFDTSTGVMPDDIKAMEPEIQQLWTWYYKYYNRPVPESAATF